MSTSLTAELHEEREAAYDAMKAAERNLSAVQKQQKRAQIESAIRKLDRAKRELADAEAALQEQFDIRDKAFAEIGPILGIGYRPLRSMRISLRDGYRIVDFGPDLHNLGRYVYDPDGRLCSFREPGVKRMTSIQPAHRPSAVPAEAWEHIDALLADL